MITADYEELKQMAQDNMCAEQPGVVEPLEKRAVRHRPTVPTTKKGMPDTALLPKYDTETGELLPIEMVTALVDYAGRYGLDAYRGHVMCKHGKPYITIDGYLWHASRQAIPYQMVSRPMVPKERKRSLIPEGTYAWLCTLTILDTGGIFQGQGIITTDEISEMSKRMPEQRAHPVVAEHPWQIARKRAEWQALRRAFPIGEETKESNEARD